MITLMRQITLGTTDYMFCFTSVGGAAAVNLATGAVTTVAPGATFTSEVAIDQWKSERAVIADNTNGYFAWDGTTLYSPGSVGTVSVTVGGTGFTSAPVIGFTGGGGTGATATASIQDSSVISISLVGAGSGYTSAPTVTFTGGGGSGATASAYIMPSGQTGSAIAVYSGRVWIAKNRTVTYTAPGTWLDFSAAAASGSTTLSEGFLRQAIYGMRALENYLYIWGDSSIYLIGDLKVTGAVTTFSLTNLSSTTGSTFPNTFTSYERAILFMNKYGVYATFGASVQKVSQALDGIFPDIDFDTEPSAGLATIFNILCYVVNFQYTGNGENRALQAVYFNQKWFLTSQGDSLVFIAPATVDGEQRIYSTTDNDITQMYADPTNAVDSTMKTALLPLENPIQDKQVQRIGVEYTAPAETQITLSVDTENDTQVFVFNAVNLVEWENNSNAVVVWHNNSSQVVDWLVSGFVTSNAYADVVGKYVGYTVESSSPQIIIHGLLGEYVPRAFWE